MDTHMYVMDIYSCNIFALNTQKHITFSLALWTKERIKEKDDDYSLACLKKNMRLN